MYVVRNLRQGGGGGGWSGEEGVVFFYYISVFFFLIWSYLFSFFTETEKGERGVFSAYAYGSIDKGDICVFFFF